MPLCLHTHNPFHGNIPFCIFQKEKEFIDCFVSLSVMVVSKNFEIQETVKNFER
jgi:hypothetical protein